MGGNKKTFYSADVDMFLYGLDEEGAMKVKMIGLIKKLTFWQKIKEIHEVMLAKRKKTTCIRTSRTLTICSDYERHVQIVLRLYSIPAEVRSLLYCELNWQVLLGFDLDCVAVGFDGENVWALPRARRAFNYRYNITDPTRQTFRTTSYEYRLYKYSKRGFAIAVPGFKRR
jgi:hypothetical protein